MEKKYIPFINEWFESGNCPAIELQLFHLILIFDTNRKLFHGKL